MAHDIQYEPELPEGWEPIEPMCSPREGSKGYRREDGANAHLINMYDSGRYVAQLETADGDFYQERYKADRESGLAVQLNLGIDPRTLFTKQVGYLAARLDLERVVYHYEETGELPVQEA